MIALKHIMSRSIILLIAALGLFTSKSHAGIGTSMMQTADLVGVGNWELGTQADVIFNRGGGFNVSAHGRTGILDQYLDLELLAGAGTTNFQFGGTLKYNLLPDVDGQVGISFLGAFSYLRDDINNITESFLLPGAAAIVSKRVEFFNGFIIPYGAFQYEFLMGPQDNSHTLSLIAGSRWENKNLAPWAFYTEFTFGIKNSLYMFSVGASYPF